MNKLLNAFLTWEKKTPQNIFLRQPISGQWKTWNYADATLEIRRMAAALRSLDFPEKSNIAILSKNCAHWLLADIAIMLSGHISVPLYANSSASSLHHILEHSGVKAIFVGKLDEYEKQRLGISSGIKKISIPIYGIHEGLTWDELISEHEPLADSHAADDHDLLTIMYTSGTTGVPKGAMFNSFAFDFTIDRLIDLSNKIMIMPAQLRLFSYLPLCHIAERNMTEMLAIKTGACVSFVESLDTFARDLESVQPDIFFGVPRIWAKFQEKILQKMPQQNLDRLLRIPILRGIVRKSIKKKLGVLKAGLLFTAAAPIPLSLLKWFSKLGVTLREIYGMTENCGLSHANQEVIRFGTVGPAILGVEVIFTEDHEILTRHPALMLGYYKEPELTAEVFTSDGFLRTGDTGTQDSDGFVTITGRVKDQFKTDKGKYIFPAPIEMQLLTSSLIDQVCVVGMGIPQPIALIALSELGKSKSADYLDQQLTELLNRMNQNLESYERVKKAVIMSEDWTIEKGLMTPTLKVKRNEVEKIHMHSYQGWYHEDAVVIWEKV